MVDTNEPDETKTSRNLLPLFLAFLGGLVLSLGLLGAFLIGRSSNETETTSSPTTSDQISPTTVAEATTTEAPTTTEASSTTEAPTTTTEAPTTTTEPEPVEDESATGDVETTEGTDGNRIARLSNGVLTLEGAVPSEEIANEIASRAEAILGEGNVINNYEIDPDIPFADSGPLVVEDLILFPTSSAEINPAFTPLLDLGTSLLAQFPNVTITVVAHTDAVGPAEQNLALSQARGEAVQAFWAAQGVDPARITVDARGESDLLVPTDGAEQANRRVEFIITGLLG